MINPEEKQYSFTYYLALRRFDENLSVRMKIFSIPSFVRLQRAIFGGKRSIGSEWTTILLGVDQRLMGPPERFDFFPAEGEIASANEVENPWRISVS